MMPGLDVAQVGERAGRAATARTASTPVLPRLGERLLVFARDRHPVAEDVGLGVVDLEPRHAVDELEQRAVVVGGLVGGRSRSAIRATSPAASVRLPAASMR